MYPSAEKCSGMTGLQGIDCNVIIVFHILSSCGGLSNGRDSVCKYAFCENAVLKKKKKKNKKKTLFNQRI